MKGGAARLCLACQLVVIFLLFAAGCSTPVTETGVHSELKFIYEAYPELADKPAETAVVETVVDGDTLETSSGDKVRLIGVDTPEVYGGIEYFGKEASSFSKQALTGKRVLMFRDVSETDRYSRLLRYVFIEGETVMFNETLLAEGYASAVTFPPDVALADRFMKIAREAREHDKGLWAKTEQDTGRQSEAACADPQIKGNINSRGDKIYHAPGSSHYKQTIAEKMFCTEEEAIAAGFRKPGA